MSQTKITRFARDKDCQVRYIGICCGDPARSIWSHNRAGSAGKGGHHKSPDALGAIACTPCDAAYDQMQFPPGVSYTREELDLDWAHGHYRSLCMLLREGLVK